MKNDFSHIDENGKIRMVDVGEKNITRRTAKASCIIIMKQSTLNKITANRIKKGNVFNVAEIAGIFAAKRVGELIPLCHSISPDHIKITFQTEDDRGILKIYSMVTVTARTGAEMEALQAVSQAALTIYDMCKAVDRGMTITDIQLVEKEGGKSGKWKRGG